MLVESFINNNNNNNNDNDNDNDNNNINNNNLLTSDLSPWLPSWLDRGALINVEVQGCGTSVVRGPKGHK